jgi:PPOX class F420-dependent enzyme/OxyR family protein
MALDDVYVRYLTSHRQGRLATVAPDGSPQVKPVGYRYNPGLGTIDIAGFSMERSAKYRNIAARPAVSFVVDDSVGEGALGMRFLEIRGEAEQARSDSPEEQSAAEQGDGMSPYLIRIHPRRLVSWNLDPENPGMHSTNVPAGETPAAGGEDRPALEAGGAIARQAADAVGSLVEELQAGWDARDAGISNRHVAADILWGSPFGATVHDYGELHAIHTRLKRQGRGGPAARFEVVRVLAPAPGVALAQVRRTALDPDGNQVEPSDDVTGPFSEMILYVLVRRGGTWWLAAAQNTPIRPAPPG